MISADGVRALSWQNTLSPLGLRRFKSYKFTILIFPFFNQSINHCPQETLLAHHRLLLRLGSLPHTHCPGWWHKVIATSRNPSSTPDLVVEIEGNGGKWVHLDVDSAQCGYALLTTPGAPSTRLSRPASRRRFAPKWRRCTLARCA